MLGHFFLIISNFIARSTCQRWMRLSNMSLVGGLQRDMFETRFTLIRSGTTKNHTSITKRLNLFNLIKSSLPDVSFKMQFKTSERFFLEHLFTNKACRMLYSPVSVVELLTIKHFCTI